MRTTVTNIRNRGARIMVGRKIYRLHERRMIGRAIAAALIPIRTQREVGKILGLSKTMVYFIEEQALFKIYIRMIKGDSFIQKAS